MKVFQKDLYLAVRVDFSVYSFKVLWLRGTLNLIWPGNFVLDRSGWGLIDASTLLVKSFATVCTNVPIFKDVDFISLSIVTTCFRENQMNSLLGFAN